MYLEESIFNEYDYNSESSESSISEDNRTSVDGLNVSLEFLYEKIKSMENTIKANNKIVHTHNKRIYKQNILDRFSSYDIDEFFYLVDKYCDRYLCRKNKNNTICDFYKINNYFEEDRARKKILYDMINKSEDKIIEYQSLRTVMDYDGHKMCLFCSNAMKKFIESRNKKIKTIVD